MTWPEKAYHRWNHHHKQSRLRLHNCHPGQGHLHTNRTWPPQRHNNLHKADIDPTTTHIQNINKVLKEVYRNKQITSKQYNFLILPHSTRTLDILYFLKKTHKNPRPDVSSCNFATENISRFIDTYVPPTSSKQLPSYIKDTKARFCSLRWITTNPQRNNTGYPTTREHYMQTKHTAKHLYATHRCPTPMQFKN